MFNKEILKVQQSQLEITREEYKRTKDLIESGIFSPRQIFEIEANLASQEQSVVLAENNLRDVKLNLAQVLLIDDMILILQMKISVYLSLKYLKILQKKFLKKLKLLEMILNLQRQIFP